MFTLSYILGTIEKIKVGTEYYFGQLWDGDGDGEELLESEAVAVDSNIVSFKILDSDTDIMRSMVLITGIY